MNLTKLILLVGLFIFQLNIIAQEAIAQDTLHFKGTYQGKNLFIKNSFLGDGKGFCVKMVYVNDKMIMAKTNQSAFEIKFDSLSINNGDEIDIKIAFVGEKEPNILNMEAIEKRVIKK